MDEARTRWRLVLGQLAEDALGCKLDAHWAARDRALQALYGRALQARDTRMGGSGPSVLDVPAWVRELRKLFPVEVCETITGHALDRFGMKELVTDPEVLDGLTPDYELLKAVLSFKGMMEGPALQAARRVVEAVVEQLTRQLEREVQGAFATLSRRQAARRVGRPSELELARTLRGSLRHWDPEEARLTAVVPWFRPRHRRHVPWDVIIAVDCSGSMTDSVVHAAVLAAILARTSFLRVRLAAFDTALVDLSEQVDDPVGVLMSVQLGGGTDIAGAVGWCAEQVEHPSRTIVAVITDFYEGGSEAALLSHVRAMCGAGVKVWGLACLDAEGAPVYDRRLAAACADAGAKVGAVTPGRFCAWIAAAMS
jgi:Mg-chelatase subunit ChlD